MGFGWKITSRDAQMSNHLTVISLTQYANDPTTLVRLHPAPFLWQWNYAKSETLFNLMRLQEEKLPSLPTSLSLSRTHPPQPFQWQAYTFNMFIKALRSFPFWQRWSFFRTLTRRPWPANVRNFRPSPSCVCVRASFSPLDCELLCLCHLKIIGWYGLGSPQCLFFVLLGKMLLGKNAEKRKVMRNILFEAGASGDDVMKNSRGSEEVLDFISCPSLALPPIHPHKRLYVPKINYVKLWRTYIVIKFNYRFKCMFLFSNPSRFSLSSPQSNHLHTYSPRDPHEHDGGGRRWYLLRYRTGMKWL